MFESVRLRDLPVGGRSVIASAAVKDGHGHTHRHTNIHGDTQVFHYVYIAYIIIVIWYKISDLWDDYSFIPNFKKNYVCQTEIGLLDRCVNLSNLRTDCL